MKIALLIDADNAQAKQLPKVMHYLQNMGQVQIRKICGNWHNTNLKPWHEQISAYALKPEQQFDPVKGKNSTDILMVIHAMEILFKHPEIDAFCLMTSDADFTALAVHLRQYGKTVIAAGRSQAAETFIHSCHHFLHLSPPVVTPPVVAKVSGDDHSPCATTYFSDTCASNVTPIKQVEHIAKAAQGANKQEYLFLTCICDAIKANQEANSGYAPLGAVGTYLANKGLKYKDFGLSKLSQIADNSAYFSLQKKGTVNFIALKANAQDKIFKQLLQ